MSINPYILPGLGLDESTIKRLVCHSYQIKIEQLLLSKRPYLEARYLVMYFAARYLGSKRGQLAGMFSKKSHSTACNAIEKIQNLIETNVSFRNRVDEIDRALKAVLLSQTVKKHRHFGENIDNF